MKDKPLMVNPAVIGLVPIHVTSSVSHVQMEHYQSVRIKFTKHP